MRAAAPRWGAAVPGQGNRRLCVLLLLFSIVTAFAGSRQHIALAQEPVVLQVCSTIPDLGGLARIVGGDHVSVTVFAKGTENPHFVEARPSFVKALSQADLFVMNGMSLEIGWAPVLLEQSRNARIQVGTLGHVDAGEAVTPLNVPAGVVDRSMGDVHPEGNPHYLLDPICGIQVARLLCARMSALRPAWKPDFEARLTAFEKEVCTRLVGDKLAEDFSAADVEKLATLFEHGKLADFLSSQNRDGQLSGWLGAMTPHAGVKVVADHDLWPYFSRRFGVDVVAFMEPKPGVPPTTKHLGEVIKTMQAAGVRIVIHAAYFDRRHARVLSDATSAVVVEMAHQVGSDDAAASYLDMVETNVSRLANACESR